MRLLDNAMVLAAIAAVVLGPPAIVCPVSGRAIAPDSKMVDVNGIRFRFCGPNCSESFKKEPLSFLKSAASKGWIAAVGVFDPVVGRKLTPQSARGGVSDFEGVRFAFLNPRNKSTFDREPKPFGIVPEKWSPDCPVMAVSLAHTYGASGYVDAGGVRYFACCDQCMPKLRSAALNLKNPKIEDPKPFDVPAVWAKLSGPGL